VTPRLFTLSRGLPALVYAGWIAWLSSSPVADSTPLPFPHFDKILHFLLFSGLGATVRWAFPVAASRRQLLVAWSMCAGYGILDEFHQSFVSGRHADPLDALADAAGAAAMIVSWQLVLGSCSRR
jgi:VanZ family protein